MGSELLDGAAAQQAGVGCVGPEGEGCATQLLTVALLAVLQTLKDQQLKREESKQRRSFKVDLQRLAQNEPSEGFTK